MTEIIKPPGKVYTMIERKVVTLYKVMNILNIPIDPFDIAKRQGYVLKPYSAATPEQFVKLKNNAEDGVSYYDTELCTFVIWYRDDCCVERQRFTVMHEIGHIDLGHRCESELARIMANYYAAYALAPSPLIQHYKCHDYIDTAYAFGISERCAYLCFQRYINWLNYSGDLKDYEKSLIELQVIKC